MKRIECRIIIDARPELVWDVITDFDSYPQWNRFTPRFSLRSSELAVGAELDLDCWISEEKLLRDEHEVILAVDRQRLAFCMGTSPRRGRPGVRSQRWQICEALEDGRTRFVNHEAFSGPLAPLVTLLYTAKLRRAFRRYCQDLKSRVEQMAQEAGRARFCQDR